MRDEPKSSSSDQWWQAGFDAESVAAWQDVAADLLVDDFNLFSPDEDLVRIASRWCIAGFSPSDALRWREQLGADDDQWCFLPQKSAAWRKAGFTPKQAVEWSRGSWPHPGESPTSAKLLRESGWYPVLAWMLRMFTGQPEGEEWDDAGHLWLTLPPEHALNCARAGLSPDEASDRRDIEPARLESELRARFRDRVPIDPYVAMHVNHHMWILFAWEIPDDAPFYAEPLWDLHYQENERAIAAGLPPVYGLPQIVKPRGAERAMSQAGAQRTPVCRGSGGSGLMIEIFGSDEWYIDCAVCGARWAGGPINPVPDH